MLKSDLMSRGKVRAPSDVCADCSAQDPKWASINRGVLMCDECCSVHRSLGRHISHVKSLKKGSWHPTLLAMVHQLVSLGANNIWEHALLDPGHKGVRRKPNPRDQLHPTKADFIRAKYQFLAFAQKHKDGEPVGVEDLSKQLHSSVRTANLETCLRLLSLGANPNYYHPDKHNCPLHVAASAGQASQVELLVVYGADPGAPDMCGKTPVDYARSERHIDLADRLVELQYELTDRLAYYLCERKPDHRIQHFIIPEMADSSLDLSELAKAAKKKLQELPNHLFEELAMDVYDEVDRRINDEIWLSSQNHNTVISDRQTVPFLPVNPEFSSTRNQGRQKLARFNRREFATLIIDILSDARRRQQGITSPTQTPHKEQADFPGKTSGVKKTSSFSDDEPVYDSVASDEDYSSIGGGDNQSLKDSDVQKDTSTQEDQRRSNDSPTSMISFTESMASSESEGTVNTQDYTDMKRQLVNSETTVHQLMETNRDLRQQIQVLQATSPTLPGLEDPGPKVQRLMQENATLKQQTSRASPITTQSLPNGHDNSLRQTTSLVQTSLVSPVSSTHSQPSFTSQAAINLRSSRPLTRPQSMIETRNQSKLPWQKTYAPFRDDNALLGGSHRISEEFQIDDHDLQSIKQDSKEGNASDSDYDNATKNEDDRHTDSTITPPSPDSSLKGASGVCSQEPGLPSQEQIVKKTERITKKIQELLLSAQEGKHESFIPCSEKINQAVGDMFALFPPLVSSDRIREALHQLTGGAARLLMECKSPPVEHDGQIDYRAKTQQVIQCAYEIAKAAKLLVTFFELV